MFTKELKKQADKLTLDILNWVYWHYCHLGLDNPLLMGILLCTAGCLVVIYGLYPLCRVVKKFTEWGWEFIREVGVLVQSLTV